MTEQERERLIAILDRLAEELRRGDDRAALLQAINWQWLDRLPDAALVEAVLALGEQFPPREEQG